MKKAIKLFLILLLALSSLFTSCDNSFSSFEKPPIPVTETTTKSDVDFATLIGPVKNKCGVENKAPFIQINNNKTFFDESDYKKASKGVFIELSKKDWKGRVGYGWGCFDYAHRATKPREDISRVKPTGWIQKMYDVVKGRALYNRAHILMRELSCLEADDRNLMTGTRDFNQETMLKFEKMVTDHTNEYRTHHILYRVTPDFRGNNLLAHGVLMEASCLECRSKVDDFEFCIYARNQQPKIVLNYLTGESEIEK